MGNLHNSGILDKLQAPDPLFLLNHLDWISLSGVFLTVPEDCTLPATH